MPDKLFSICDIQEYFKYFMKKHETLNNKLSGRTCVNKIENQVTFKIKYG